MDTISEYLKSRDNAPSSTIDTLDKNYKAIESFIEKEIIDNKRVTYLKREEGETLDGVGKLIGVTRERVRQIEKTALKKLSQSGTLKEFKPEGKLVKTKEKDRNVRDYNFVLKK